MTTSPKGNIFRVTGPLWGESTGNWWIPLTKASDVELWYFLWYVQEQSIEQTIETPVILDAIALIMTSLQCSGVCRGQGTCMNDYIPNCYVGVINHWKINSFISLISFVNRNLNNLYSTIFICLTQTVITVARYCKIKVLRIFTRKLITNDMVISQAMHSKPLNILQQFYFVSMYQIPEGHGHRGKRLNATMLAK